MTSTERFRVGKINSSLYNTPISQDIYNITIIHLYGSISLDQRLPWLLTVTLSSLVAMGLTWRVANGLSTFQFSRYLVTRSEARRLLSKRERMVLFSSNWNDNKCWVNTKKYFTIKKKQFLLIQSTARIFKYMIHTLKTPVFEARRKETVMYKSV